MAFQLPGGVKQPALPILKQPTLATPNIIPKTPAKPQQNFVLTSTVKKPVAKPVSPFGNDLLKNPTGQQIYDYANQQAQRRYNDQNNGYTKQEQLINNQKKQLMNDADIKKRAEYLYGDLKYGYQFDAINQQRRQAEDQYTSNHTNLDSSYNKAIEQLAALAARQRGDAKVSAFERGLGNSSVLDTSVNMINQSESSGATNLAQDYTNNLAELDRGIATLKAGLSDQEARLTKNQRAEIVNAINEMTKERNNKQSDLDLTLRQIAQDRTYALRDKSGYANEVYNDLFGKYGSMARQDRQFEESKRQYEKDYALRLKQLAKSVSGGSSGGTKKTTTKPTPKSDPKKDAALLDALDTKQRAEALKQAGKEAFQRNMVYRKYGY